MWIDKYTDKYKGPYEERLKKAAKDITRDFRARFGSETEKYDYTPFREKRRREVAEKGLNSVKQHLRGVCDEQFLVDSRLFGSWINCLSKENWPKLIPIYHLFQMTSYLKIC